jgi:isopenicillin-N epimerase
VVALPHLGASTREAEENCAVMVVDQLRDYLEDGNIANAVNFPSVAMERESPGRVAIANANVPNMLGQISTTMANAGLNIHNMVNKSRGEMAYTLVDVDIALPFVRESFVAQVMAAVTPRTRLLFVSHIASTTALILPVADLVAAAHALGLPVLVDAAHAPGQLDVDLDAIGADFTTGNCHKWLCAPKGTAFLHARPEHHASLDATVTSWGYVAGSGGHTGFDAYTGRSTLERRLQWQGTRDICSCLAVAAAIDFHRQHLTPAVREQCHRQAVALMADLARRFALEPIGCDSDFAQMAPIPVPPCDAEALRKRLYEDHRVEVPVTQHEGRTFVRVSVQGYNSADELQRLREALLQAVQRQ